MLNGPQGTTFGAGAMSGAIRYITNKPDVARLQRRASTSTAGQIQGGGQNWTYEAFINLPLIDGVLGFRASAFSDSHGGFINNQLTTRTWVNGAVSNNSPWAGNDYNREHVKGGRLALQGRSSARTGAPASPIASSVSTPAVPGTRIRRCRRAPWSASVRSRTTFEAKMLDLHVEGDVGIGDLVFASTFW